jgi:hypothetical protein
VTSNIVESAPADFMRGSIAWFVPAKHWDRMKAVAGRSPHTARSRDRRDRVAIVLKTTVRPRVHQPTTDGISTSGAG